MADGGSDRTPLLAEEGVVRQRAGTGKEDVVREREEIPEPGSDWDPDLPYGGKVYLARRKKPDPLHVRVIEAAVIILTLSFALYAYYYFDHLHYNVTRGYAHLGYSSAQHQVGQRFLHGLGVNKDQHHAMEWFKLAADQGHPHASYNLAVGHLQGIRTDMLDKGLAADQGHPHASYNLAVGHLQGIRTDMLDKGEPHRLIAHAASKGVKEAHHALNEICTRGGCD